MTLRIGSQETAAEILDESASGLSLGTGTDVDVSPGQRILLRNESLWLEVEVVNLQVVSDSQLRLGVKRLREFDESEVHWEESAKSWWNDFKTNALRALVRPFGIILGLILGVPVLLIVLLWVLERATPLPLEPSDNTAEVERRASHPRKTRPAPRGTKHHLDTIVHKIDEIVGKTPNIKASALLPRSAEAASAPHSQASTESLAERVEAILPDSVLRSVLPKQLLEPEMTRRLGLSAEQLDKLRQISDDAAAGSVGRVEHDFGRRVMQVLTDEQRDLLQEITSVVEPDEPKQSVTDQPSAPTSPEGE